MNNVGRREACLAQLDSESFIVVVGTNDGGVKDRVFLRRDIGAGTWTDLPKPTVARTSAVCGASGGN